MRKLWKRAAALVVSAALAGAMLPSAFSEEATDAVEAKLTTMTLREKVGQLFWVRPETLDFSLNPEKKMLTQTMRQNLEQYPVGGIAVFKKNIQDENQLSSLIADFQSASKIPMIVAVDEEGGAVARLANHEAFSLPKYTSARDIGKTGDPEQARQMGRTIGGYLRFYGFNLDFAPIADVDSNPANPVIGRRAYSTDAQQTAQMVAAAVEGFHEAGMLCLADEAHGTHFYFGNGLPVSAMAAGADMASVSMHKSGGSLTQSSLLLIGPNVHPGYVRQIINLTQTTSGSYLLMSSLDISRRNLALRGRQVFHQVADMAEYAREEINAVGGYYAFGKELCNGNSVFDFDTTKLSVHTLDIGLAGIEVYDILRDEYDIQIEFGDIGNILAYLSIGDRPQEVERLVSALAEIKRRYRTDGSGLLSQEYIDPVVAASPQEAFYAPKKSLPLRETEGMVCSEFVMCYPPGIPILAPGERITKEILNYIEYAKAKGCSMTGPEDPDILHLNVLA